MNGPSRPVRVWLVLAVAAASGCGRDPALDEFGVWTFRAPSGRKLPYRLLNPPDGAAGGPHPLVLWLHGAGERGTENEVHLGNGLEVLAQPAFRAAHPAFVLAPQCPEDEDWPAIHGDGAGGYAQDPQPTPVAQDALALVAELRGRPGVDGRRIYVAGLSMGGSGAWDFAARRRDLFAAALPMSGRGALDTAAALVGLPIWAFHGADDDIISPRADRELVAAIRAAGGDARYTEIPAGEPGSRHGDWADILRRPGVLDWLFAQAMPGS